MAAKKRNIMHITIRRNEATDGSKTYGFKATIPLGDADAVDSENCAAFAMGPINAQLDFSKSKYRVVMYDTEAKQVVVAKID